MAAAILFAGMLAVMTALMGGQQQVFETQLQLEAALAAEEKMQITTAMVYSEIADGYDTFDVNGLTLIRQQSVHPVQYQLPSLGVRVSGKDVTVTVYDDAGTRALAELKAFIPEPQP